MAQLVRAPPCHGGGRGFESHPGRIRSVCRGSHFSGRIEDSSKVNPEGIYLWDLSSAGRASALQAEGHRFEPYRSHLMADYKLVVDGFADMAQLAEQLICNQQVNGSSPFIGL